MIRNPSVVFYLNCWGEPAKLIAGQVWPPVCAAMPFPDLLYEQLQRIKDPKHRKRVLRTMKALVNPYINKMNKKGYVIEGSVTRRDVQKFVAGKMM